MSKLSTNLRKITKKLQKVFFYESTPDKTHLLVLFDKDASSNSTMLFSSMSEATEHFYNTKMTDHWTTKYDAYVINLETSDRRYIKL